MEFKEKAQIVAVSVVLAVALAAGMYQLVKPKGPNRNPTDDAPIIMAGGSLYLGNEGLTFTKSNHNLVVSDATLQPFEVDVEGVPVIPPQPSVLPVPANATGDIVVDYCKDYPNCKAFFEDHITIHFEPGKAITISDTLNRMDRAERLLLNLRAMRNKKWQMNQITLTWTGMPQTTRDCGSDGECSLVIHTCQNGGGANCVAIQ